MPITPFLDGHRFDRESERVLALLWQIFERCGIPESVFQ
jgi:hypothetical protein